jgi:hypothetical protein
MTSEDRRDLAWKLHALDKRESTRPLDRLCTFAGLERELEEDQLAEMAARNDDRPDPRGGLWPALRADL